jgi:hypothetical protein
MSKTNETHETKKVETNEKAEPARAITVRTKVRAGIGPGGGCHHLG